MFLSWHPKYCVLNNISRGWGLFVLSFLVRIKSRFWQFYIFQNSVFVVDYCLHWLEKLPELDFIVLAAFLGIEYDIRLTGGDFLSFGISHSICKSQQDFLDSGQLVRPLKKRPNKNFPADKCVWYRRNLNCSPDSGSSNMKY